MKLKICLISLLFFAIVIKGQSQCVSGFAYFYTGTANFIQFKDKSVPPVNWVRSYTHWNFNDGSSIDTNKVVVHQFPQALTYKVVKETQFSEPGNPSNVCSVRDSLLINVASSNPAITCYPHQDLQLTWLTSTTYGISSYVSGPCIYNLSEIVIDTVTPPPITPDTLTGIYITHQNYFTYTKPNPSLNFFTINYHMTYPDQNGPGGINHSYYISGVNYTVAIPTNCHASFFMTPDSTGHNWTIQNFSSGYDSLSYHWDFGDGNTSILALPSHTYASVGRYKICLTVSSGTCSTYTCRTPFVDTTIASNGILTLNSQPSIVTNVMEKNKQAFLTVFPNPAGNELNVMYPFKNEDYTIIIHNLLGQKVLTQKLSGSSVNAVNIPVEELQNGLYQVQVNSGTGSVLAKTRFVKQ